MTLKCHCSNVVITEFRVGHSTGVIHKSRDGINGDFVNVVVIPIPAYNRIQMINNEWAVIGSHIWFIVIFVIYVIIVREPISKRDIENGFR